MGASLWYDCWWFDCGIWSQNWGREKTCSGIIKTCGDIKVGEEIAEEENWKKKIKRKLRGIHSRIRWIITETL